MLKYVKKGSTQVVEAATLQLEPRLNTPANLLLANPRKDFKPHNVARLTIVPRVRAVLSAGSNGSSIAAT
jgi:hypothetical protein